MLLNVGGINKNLQITPTCWHSQIKQPTYPVIFSNWDKPTLIMNQV
jgi:hypothetical protein